MPKTPKYWGQSQVESRPARSPPILPANKPGQPPPIRESGGGTKRSLLVDRNGIPIECVVAAANRHDSLFLWPMLEKLSRLGFYLPKAMTVNLDAGYDSTGARNLLDELGCDGNISTKHFPLQAGACWPGNRMNSWHTRGFKKLQVCTEKRTCAIDAFTVLADAVIITRRLIRAAWTTHR